MDSSPGLTLDDDRKTSIGETVQEPVPEPGEAPIPAVLWITDETAPAYRLGLSLADYDVGVAQGYPLDPTSDEVFLPTS